MRCVGTLVIALLLLSTLPARAEDEEPNIEFFYPVVTRRPVIERELELNVRHEKGRGGRETETAGAIELPLLPWWQLEVEVPLVFTDPRDGPSEGGFGDLAVQNKFLLWKSVEHRALVAGGFELTLPSGSERRGLGGTAAVRPFMSRPRLRFPGRDHSRASRVSGAILLRSRLSQDCGGLRPIARPQGFACDAAVV